MHSPTARTVPERATSTASVILLIAGILLVAANLRVSITSVGPLVDTIRGATGLSHTWAGMLTTLPLLAFAVFSPIAPKVARRIGMERTIFFSLLLLAAGIGLRSVPSLLLLFLGTFLLGVGIAVGNVLLPALIKRDFQHRVGLMTGLYSAMMNVWAAIASGISVPVSQMGGFGWRGSLACWAVFAAVAALIWLPQLRQLHRPGQAASGAPIWRSKLAWQVTLYMGLQSLIFYVSLTWLPGLLHDRGMSDTNAGWMISLMQFVNMPATLLIPILAGKLNNQRILVFLIAAVSFAGYCGLLIGSASWTWLWIVLAGLAQGASLSLSLMFFSLRTKTPQQAAELSGMAQSVGYLLAAVGPIAFGFLHDITHAWTLPLIGLCAASLILCVIGLAQDGMSTFPPERGRDVLSQHSSPSKRFFESFQRLLAENKNGLSGTKCAGRPFFAHQE